MPAGGGPKLLVAGLFRPVVVPPSLSTRTDSVPGRPLIVLLHAGALNEPTSEAAVLTNGSIWNSHTLPRVATVVTAGSALLLVWV